MPDIALFEAFPVLKRQLPRLALGDFPTPVERSSALSKSLGCELYIKRDDRSGHPYGGNKVRKLEFVFGDLKERNKDALITIGGLGSHHVLATALYGKEASLKVAAALFPQPLTAHAQDTLSLTLGSGALVEPVPMIPLVPVAVASLYAKLRAKNKEVAFVAPGGSSSLGTIGYVNAALELALQIEKGLLPTPDLVVAPLGSNGTVAGLALGLRLAGIPSLVWGVRVVDRIAANGLLTLRLAAATAQLLKKKGLKDPRLSVPWDLKIIHDQFGAGYAYPTEAATQAKEEAQQAGISLETTYTAKAMAALFHNKEAIAGRKVLFWNTFSSADLSSLPRKDPKKLLGERRLQALQYP